MKSTINIEDLKTAFSYKSNNELRHSYFIFKVLQYPKLLKLLTAITNGVIKYNLPFQFLIKKTVFKIFCAGENIEETFALIKKLEKYHVKSVLDYVSEGEKTEAVFTENTRIIAANIVKLGKENPGNYISVKISGLEDIAFIEKVNGKVFPTDPALAPRFDKLLARLDLICKTASDSKVVVFFDAEDRFMQDIFDAMIEHLMERYNKESAIVFNTLQMYLKDRLDYIDYLVKEAQEKKYISGIKLVRGAYVEKERETAYKLNIPSPVYDTKDQTDAAYDAAVDKCLRNYAYVDTCVATHNEKSTLNAIACIAKYNVPDYYNKVRFSQLYGMSDNITFNLSANGYNASKYLPYGEVKKAIPYLIRRSEENSSMNGQVSRELIQLQAELNRRASQQSA
jgi:proline dehydrogenase